MAPYLKIITQSKDLASQVGLRLLVDPVLHQRKNTFYHTEQE